MLKFLSRKLFISHQDSAKVSVLFVCMANYCRSPMAEGIFKQVLSERGLSQFVKVGSAGTHVSVQGRRPDIRARQALSPMDIDIAPCRSRKIDPLDFVQYDHILAMDDANYRSLLSICPDEYQHKVTLIMSYAPQTGVTEVPDPYYSNAAGFKRVYTLLQQGAQGFLDTIVKEHELP